MFVFNFAELLLMVAGYVFKYMILMFKKNLVNNNFQNKTDLKNSSPLFWVPIFNIWTDQKFSFQINDLKN